MRSISQAQLNFTTHHAVIKVDEEGHIYVFKYNGAACDMDSFDDLYVASEYIIESLPQIYYKITFPGED